MKTLYLTQKEFIQSFSTELLFRSDPELVFRNCKGQFLDSWVYFGVQAAVKRLAEMYPHLRPSERRDYCIRLAKLLRLLRKCPLPKPRACPTPDMEPVVANNTFTEVTGSAIELG